MAVANGARFSPSRNCEVFAKAYRLRGGSVSAALRERRDGVPGAYQERLSEKGHMHQCTLGALGGCIACTPLDGFAHLSPALQRETRTTRPKIVDLIRNTHAYCSLGQMRKEAVMDGTDFQGEPVNGNPERLIAPLTMTAVEVSFQKHKIRSVRAAGTLWFVSADVCKSLEIANSVTTTRRLGSQEKGKVRLHTSSGEQEVNVVNEGGLYLLAFSSKKPEAIRFREWVTNEVLPSLRRGAAGEMQDMSNGDAYVRVPCPGRFTVTLTHDGRLTLEAAEHNTYVADFYSPEVDALALSTALVAAIWRKFRLLDAFDAFNERSNTLHQITEAIRQAEHIAQSVMRSKAELIDGEGTATAQALR